ncbi:MAG: hypothetical protein ACNS60_20755 [Candidatus Cyclobacteriaceae bacterium M2_1C_046]
MNSFKLLFGLILILVPSGLAAQEFKNSRLTNDEVKSILLSIDDLKKYQNSNLAFTIFREGIILPTNNEIDTTDRIHHYLLFAIHEKAESIKHDVHKIGPFYKPDNFNWISELNTLEFDHGFDNQRTRIRIKVSADKLEISE